MNHSARIKIEKFFSRYPAQEVPKATVLIFSNEEPEAVYKVDSGRVIQYDIANDGSQIHLNVFKPPAFFPMSWVINDTHDNYCFETHSDCVIRKAPRDEVLQFLRKEPDVMFDLLSRLYRGIHGMHRRAVYMTKGDARQRLVVEMIIGMQRFGELQTDGSFALPFSEVDLAGNSGLSRETVNREIAKMKKLSLVSVKNKKLYVSSAEKLELYLL